MVMIELLFQLCKQIFLETTPTDPPSHSLKDSNANLKVKTSKERVRVHSLAHNTSKVRGACSSSGMGT
jgi:hypothetical protein